jgi:hypothetical protein
MNLPIQLKRTPPLITLALLCFAFLPQIQAVPNALPPPTPDGCYPGFTTAEGCNALANLTTGAGNTGVGWYALFFAGASNFNTGLGAGTLVLNTADSNTAVGAAALLLNNTGPMNTAVGTDALVHNDTGDSNTAVGAFALFTNAGAGISNNAIGRDALFNNTTGSFNEAIGVNALGANTTSNQNIAIGDDAMFAYTGPGTAAGGNTAVGGGALSGLTTGTLNTALGIGAGSGISDGESNNIYIGDTGFAGDTNFIAIGALAATGTPYANCFIGGIATQTQVTDGATVCEVSVRLADGRLGIDCTHPSNPGSAPQGAPRGNSAATVPRSAPPQPPARTQFQAMNDKVEKLQATVAQQQKQIETLTAQLKEEAAQFTARLKEQAAQIQKVTAQLELNKPAPKTVLNSP